jgi:predicted SAM-dependent methyltransferase
VVTLAGDRHASRVGVSLLNNAGMGDLVATMADDYVRIATELAGQPELLASLRASMRDRMRASRLMDREQMGTDLGAALRGMWQRHCEKFSSALPVESEPARQDVDLIRLHIGGWEVREGWKIFDADQREGADYVGDFKDMSMFPDACCAEIYCSHVLEHAPPQDMLKILNGLHRILIPGGKLYLSVPDLDTLAWLYLSPNLDTANKFQIMRMMFGGQLNEFDLHRIGFSFNFLIDYLRDVGFSSVDQVESFDMFEDSSTLRVEGHLISVNLVVTR